MRQVAIDMIELGIHVSSFALCILFCSIIQSSVFRPFLEQSRSSVCYQNNQGLSLEDGGKSIENPWTITRPF